YGARAWEAMADCHAMMGNPDGQLAAATKALKFEPERPSAKYQVGDALFKLGRFQQAVEALEFHNFYRNNPKWALRYGEALLMATIARPEGERNWKKLEDLFQNVKPFPVDLKVVRAAMLRQQKKTGEAEDALNTAIKQSPNYIKFRLALYDLKRAEGSVD